VLREEAMGLQALIQEILEGKELGQQEALGLFEEDFIDLLRGATQVRRHFFGRGVKLCAIVNAKSGRCPEDCAFCAQSAHHRAEIEIYPLMAPEEILQRAKEAEGMGARRFSIVISGRTPSDRELRRIAEAISMIRQETSLISCASLGILTPEKAQRLKEAGLNCYHHNLETARSFFAEVCTTHPYEEDVQTLRAAKEVGLELCSGGIFGLGESRQQRVELALTLRELGVNSVALNFLHPIPGTRLGDQRPLPPVELLRSVAVFRFLLPDRDIRICGGRAFGLRELHPLVLMAGANGLMIGNYLTTPGRDCRDDLQMIEDLELEVADG